MSEDTRGGAQDCLALVATSDTNVIECTSRAHQLNDASLIFLTQGTWMIVRAVLCGRPTSNRKNSRQYEGRPQRAAPTIDAAVRNQSWRRLVSTSRGRSTPFNRNSCVGYGMRMECSRKRCAMRKLMSLRICTCRRGWLVQTSKRKSSE